MKKIKLDEMSVKDLEKELSELKTELFKLKFSLATSGLDNPLKVREVSGMRKDMYTSMAYNYWCACQLEYKLRPQTQDTQTLVQKLTIRKARY